MANEIPMGEGIPIARWIINGTMLGKPVYVNEVAAAVVPYLNTATLGIVYKINHWAGVWEPPFGVVHPREVAQVWAAEVPSDRAKNELLITDDSRDAKIDPDFLLKYLKAERQRYNNVKSAWKATEAEVDKLCEENARLSTELEKAQPYIDSWNGSPVKKKKPAEIEIKQDQDGHYHTDGTHTYRYIR